MPLPRSIPKEQKRASRWKSTAHRDFVRKHACSNCGGVTGVEFAHVRMGSGAGMGQKPDDFRGVSLCEACHRTGSQAQHTVGEPEFWRLYQARTGETVEQLITCFNRASPRRHQIEQEMRERANG